MPYKQSNPIAGERLMGFSMRSSTTGAPQTGLTFSGAELQVLKAGGSYANFAGTVTDVGGGDYTYQFTAAELNTSGIVLLKVNKSGSSQYTLNDQVNRAFLASAITGTLTTSTFTSDRTEATNDYWKDCLVVFLTGSLAGQVKKIGGYTGSSKLFTLASGLVFTAAPANGDIFEIINR